MDFPQYKGQYEFSTYVVYFFFFYIANYWRGLSRHVCSRAIQYLRIYYISDILCILCISSNLI